MGILGSQLGNFVGENLGELLGQKLAGDKGKKAGREIFGTIGKISGSYLPFSKGGVVKKTGLAYLHAGEMVIPKQMVSKVPKSMKTKMKKGGARDM